MKRLTYILWACPLATILQTLPMFCTDPLCRAAVAAVPAIGLWGITWVRLSTNRRLPREWSLLMVLPQLWFCFLSSNTPEGLMTPFWQNLYFLMWCGTAFVGVRALLLAPDEEKPKGRVDTVLVFMSIITAFFCLSSWLNTAPFFTNH